MTNTNSESVSAAVRQEADIVRIAREVLDLETIERRGRDSLDFSEQAVWRLRAALEAAYAAGAAHAAANNGRVTDQPDAGIRLAGATVRIEDGLYCVYADKDGGELSYSTDTLGDARKFASRLPAGC